MSSPKTAEPSRGRRDPEGRRRAILNAATEIIVEKGASALTHRAVATRARVALGSTTAYFASIDELRELALQSLADEIDDALAEVERDFPSLDEQALDRAATSMHEFLLDHRQVHAAVALANAGMNDPGLRALAIRWTDHLVEILARLTGVERATAIAVYLDGATVHAALHDAPLSADAVARTIRALLTMSTEEKP